MSENCGVDSYEGCECIEGTVLDSNSECVPPTQCGCVDDDGVKHEVGIFNMGVAYLQLYFS